MRAYHLERALLADGKVHDDVLVEVEDGRFESVTPGAQPAPGSIRLGGLTVPGLANCHSHAFHRALRGRAERGSGTFWTWREQMYALAERLDPDTYLELATVVFREMVAGGITTVGEFHYLHHQAGGTPYEDPNAMGHALAEAARRAGIRLVLLDTCYLSSGFGEPLEGVQRRFGDGDAEAWAARVATIEHEHVGAAIHSVRAVPRAEIPTVVAAAAGHPVHVHLSEQPEENEQCLATYGVTPAYLLHETGALGPMTTAVHATHLTGDDVRLLAGSTVCLCPTTERDLADGIGPARALSDAGATLSLGSDSQAVVDLFEEMRALELDERLATRRRGHWTAAELLAAATRHDTLGIPDAGAIAVGNRADLVTLDTTSPRTAGTGADAHTAVFAATAADITHVVADGRLVFREGDEEEIGCDLDAVIERMWA